MLLANEVARPVLLSWARRRGDAPTIFSARHRGPPISHRASPALRDLLLALLLLGAAGLLAELILLEHYESRWQWIPLVLLVATLGSGVLVWQRPRRPTLLAFRGIMIACVLAGLAGFVLHFKGNLEFALERDAELTGFALVWKVLRGATPALAPGALAQLGLLGLVFTYRHPAVDRGVHPDQELT